MWIKLEQEELDVISDALKHLQLHGLNFLLKTKTLTISPYNFKHNKKNAIQNL